MKRKIDKDELKLQWLAALLSGDYKQTRSYLHIDAELAEKTGKSEGYCCLGVQCDIYAQLVDDKAKWNGCKFRVGTYGVCSFPPYPVRETFGLTHDQERSLSLLNDGGHSFEEIAKKIDEMI